MVVVAVAAVAVPTTTYRSDKLPVAVISGVMGYPTTLQLIAIIGASLCSACPMAPAKQQAASWCTPRPSGLDTGKYVAKYSTGFNYQPRDASEVKAETQSRFRDRLVQALAGSRLQVDDAQGQPQTLDMLVTVHNDGSNNFLIVVTVRDGWPGRVLFEYKQPYSYSDVFKAIDDAAVGVAGYYLNGWSCN